MPAVRPDILEWARTTAGLSVEEAADAIGLGAARGRTGAERLATLETEQAEISRALLLRMAKAYRRPLIAFYLAAPPRSGNRGQDFRTLPDAPAPSVNAVVDALIRDLIGRQRMARALLEDEDATPLPFIGSTTVNDDVGDVADGIARTIGFARADYRRQNTQTDAFAYLRARLEATRIFVVLASNLGSHHTNIPVEVFRGFSIADPIAPFVIINEQDARTAWSFTALHETIHLWLGQTGISGAASETTIERFCNDVAAEVLLPRVELREHLAEVRRLSVDQAVVWISEFAVPRKISRSMVAYNLFRSGALPEARWRALVTRFRTEWLATRDAERRDQGEGGPNYYVVRRHRLGPSLINLVHRSLQGGALSHTRAARLLGVKPRSVDTLVRAGGAARSQAGIAL